MVFLMPLQIGLEISGIFALVSFMGLLSTVDFHMLLHAFLLVNIHTDCILLILGYCAFSHVI